MTVIPQAGSNAAALFAVPETTWTPISKRVGLMIITTGTIGGFATTLLPQYPSLQTACQAWADTTLPGMVRLSTDIASFATAAAVDFSTLEYTVTTGAQAVAGPKYAADLARQATPLIDQCYALAPHLQAFADENQAADANYPMFQSIIGPNWPELGSAIPALAQAASAMAGGWSAIVEQLNGVTVASIESLPDSSLSSELQQAIPSWMAIAGTAAAFSLAALRQQEYLSGAWLSS